MATNIPGVTVSVNGVKTSDGTRKPLPLPQLIRCLEERLAAVHQGIASIGSLAELTEQALPHLQLLNRLESSSVL